MDYRKESLKLHAQWRGKLEVTTRAKVGDRDALSLAYTPGVAEPCLAIQKDYNKSWDLTRRWNMWPSSQTAAPCSALAISARRPACRSWRASASCLKSSAG